MDFLSLSSVLLAATKSMPHRTHMTYISLISIISPSLSVCLITFRFFSLFFKQLLSFTFISYCIDAVVVCFAKEENINSPKMLAFTSRLIKAVPFDILDPYLSQTLRGAKDSNIIIAIAKLVANIELFTSLITSQLVRKLKYDRLDLFWPIDSSLRTIALSQRIATSVQSIGACYKANRKLPIRRVLVGLYGYVHQKFSSDNSVVERIGHQAFFYRYSVITPKILAAIDSNSDTVRTICLLFPTLFSLIFPFSSTSNCARCSSWPSAKLRSLS